MKKAQIFRTFCVALIAIGSNVNAQNAAFTDNFDAKLDTASWHTGNNGTEKTFTLATENGALKVTYNRTANSNAWDQFHIGFKTPVDASLTKQITLRLKSSIGIEFALKVIYTVGDELVQKMILGDNNWNEYHFALSDKASNPVKEIVIYFNGGLSNQESGIVYLDYFTLGSTLKLKVDKSEFSNAIRYAKKLYTKAKYGKGEGLYPVCSDKGLKNRVMISEKFPLNKEISQAAIDSLTAIINDSCMAFEQRIKMANTGLIDAKATRQTKILYANLKTLMNSPHFLYGSHDATDYGVGWKNMGTDRSDIKDVSGSHGAIFSWDFSWIGSGREQLKAQKALVTRANAQGAVQTFCWHQRDPSGKSFYQKELDYQVVRTIIPGGTNHAAYKATLKKVADLAKSFRDTTTGESIPLVFRPYHEHDGNWFWWGRGNCTPEEYMTLWKFTINYLKDSLGVHNFIYAISPDGGQHNSKAEYLYAYPGDDYVDVLGQDLYFHDKESDYEKFKDRLTWTSELALEKKKVAVISEVGDELLDMPNWHTKILEQYKKSGSKVAYIATWRNAGATHFYAPYLGHSSVPDFLEFSKDKAVLLLKDLNGNCNSKLIGEDFFKKKTTIR